MSRCKECKDLLIEKNISSKKDFLKWSLENHPDKGGDNSIFTNVSSCTDEYFGLNPSCIKESPKYENPKFNPSPKYENVQRYKDIEYENFNEYIKKLLSELSNADITDESLEYLNLILNKLLCYIIENTKEGIKKSIKQIFTYELGIHAYSNCKKVHKVIISEDKIKNLLLKYYLTDITEKQLKIIACLLEYICTEILELTLKYIKDNKIDINDIKKAIEDDKDELNVLINLVLNVPNPKYFSSPKRKEPKRRASPKERKPCNPDQIRNPETGRCVLKRSPLGKKILEAMGGSPRRTSPRRASPRRASPRRASPRRKKRKLKKCDSDKIRNPKTKRCVLKTSPLGKKLLQKKMGIKSSPRKSSPKRRATPKRRLSPKRKASPKKRKPCNPDQIRNPETGRCVLKRSALGKKILEKKSKSL
jgi:hypothetical protein